MGSKAARGWFDAVVVDLVRQMRWSFLPPLMIYFSAGVSGLTAIVARFLLRITWGYQRHFWPVLPFGPACLGR